MKLYGSLVGFKMALAPGVALKCHQCLSACGVSLGHSGRSPLHAACPRAHRPPVLREFRRGPGPGGMETAGMQGGPWQDLSGGLLPPNGQRNPGRPIGLLLNCNESLNIPILPSSFLRKAKARINKSVVSFSTSKSVSF